MKQYKFYNNLVGWLVFVVAAITYLMTLEPTASYWDCGEFITTAYRLEVGHPPGAPFFMLLGRLFSLFAPDPAHVAVMINALSALASAFTILFLFWTITHLSRKIIIKDSESISKNQIIKILGSGAVGALAYTFSDTFWFSAVEGEVYGTSSMITALVFWAILKWENEANNPGANRWLIFIAYIIGLSTGVHLLNLLAIPAIALVVYYRNYQITNKGVFATLCISAAIVGAIMFIIIPWFVKLASYFELMFVNSFGLPFNSGVVFYAILLIACLVYGINYTLKHRYLWMNTIITGITMILIGYSCYATVVIRSSANPPMDQNDPDNVFSLLTYLNRDQYGSTPLFYGPYFNSVLDNKDPYVKTSKTYYRGKDKYEVAQEREEPNYNKITCTPFPRMYSSEGRHIEEYKKWVNISSDAVSVTGPDGQKQRIAKPTFGSNLSFFLRYQVNYMYWRYFMWNFAGRQNDIQGDGGNLKGNWISGIPFLDNMMLGNQSDLPARWKNNKAHNTYFLIPFILGLLGLFFQYSRGGRKGKQDCFVVAMLFFMTGLAIVLYLNQTPLQPRERDYAYAGSFYAFAIWIGMGVLAIDELLSKISPKTVSASLATVISLIAVPSLMASQNWDDHDRSDRYTARNTGVNYLNSCARNGVIFTNGDNDTFPLWYAQDVEGIRTDMRVCNLSYLQTDWYIDQMKRKAFKSNPLPISFTHDQYQLGKNDAAYIIENPSIKDSRIEVKDIMRFIKDPRTKLKEQNNLSYIPTRKLKITVDKEAVLKHGVVKPEEADKIVDQINIDLTGRYITKDQIMILDMLANNNWERPFYFAVTVGNDKYLGLEDYFQAEGFAYRFVPIKTPSQPGRPSRVATEVMYNNMMNKFDWTSYNNPDVYLDENNQRMSMNIRNNFVQLANAILDHKNPNVTPEQYKSAQDSAIEVIDFCQKVIPSKTVPFSYFGLYLADTYYRANANDKADAIVKEMFDSSYEELSYFATLDPVNAISASYEARRSFYIIQELMETAQKHNQDELFKDMSSQIDLILRNTNSLFLTKVLNLNIKQ